VPLGHNNTLTGSRAFLGAPVGLELCETGIRGSPCHLDATTRSMFRVPFWAPPLAWNFVKPGSGARRATWTQQHAQCFACFFGRPRWLATLQSRDQGFAVLLGHNNTLNVSRAALGAPVGLELCKAGFGGSPCYLDTTTRSMFRVRFWAPPLAWNFVKPGSGARRATWSQQHAQCFAWWICPCSLYGPMLFCQAETASLSTFNRNITCFRSIVFKAVKRNQPWQSKAGFIGRPFVMALHNV
jgi:hypothetical protein